MIKIVFFAPYPKIFSVIRNAFEKRPDRSEFSYEIRQDIPNNPLRELDADIVIARGFTAKALRKAGIPCTELQVSGYDVMEAVSRCRQQMPECRNIALIGTFHMIYGGMAINRIFPDVTVTQYIIEDETQMDETVQRAVREGNQAIVGTHSALQSARKFSIPALLIESGPEAVTSAISYAKEAVLMWRKEKENSERINHMMNYSFQGIISTDKSGTIIMANTYVYSLLKLQSSLLGTNLIDLFPGIPVDAVIRHGAKILSELYRYKTMTLLVNCVPVGEEGESAGVVMTFQNTTQIQRQETAIRKKLYRKEYKARYHFEDYLHESKQIAQLLEDARRYGYVDSHVLLTGETGTGKTILAQSIHNVSRRKNRFFVTVNCAAMSETALERELFGYVEGIVRGSSGEREGAFELAHQGTLFLDEISELPLRLQAKLLRVIKEHEVSRLGSSEPFPANVRIIASSSKDLRREIETGKFRSDLFYRLCVLELEIPPLRAHAEDIEHLALHSLSFQRQKLGGKAEGISKPALDLLQQYPWPGNVQELENFCERLTVLCIHSQATKEDVIRALPALTQMKETEGEQELDQKAEDVPDERMALMSLLDRFGGNRKQTAAYLGINPSTLWRRMKKLEILP